MLPCVQTLALFFYIMLAGFTIQGVVTPGKAAMLSILSNEVVEVRCLITSSVSKEKKESRFFLLHLFMAHCTFRARVRATSLIESDYRV